MLFRPLQETAGHIQVARRNYRSHTGCYKELKATYRLLQGLQVTYRLLQGLQVTYRLLQRLQATYRLLQENRAHSVRLLQGLKAIPS